MERLAHSTSFSTHQQSINVTVSLPLFPVFLRSRNDTRAEATRSIVGFVRFINDQSGIDGDVEGTARLADKAPLWNHNVYHGFTSRDDFRSLNLDRRIGRQLVTSTVESIQEAILGESTALRKSD